VNDPFFRAALLYAALAGIGLLFLFVAMSKSDRPTRRLYGLAAIIVLSGALIFSAVLSALIAG
jgi:hypothetical protein